MTERSPHPCFTFMEHEQLYDQVSHTRFMALVMQPDVDIHQVELSTNNFGEYLFVTLSCRTQQTKQYWTFWGLGYHEYRERWMVDRWQWYETYPPAKTLPVLSKEDVFKQIQEREGHVRSKATPTKPSRRAQLYEFLADLTDEDGALSELEDLGWAFLGDDAEGEDEE